MDNLHRPCELRGSLKHWAHLLSFLCSSNEPEETVEVSSQQPSWEVELKSILSSSSGAANPSATIARPFALAIESTAFAKLQELLSLSALQLLEHKGLDSVEGCLNDLAADGLLSNETVVRLSSTLE